MSARILAASVAGVVVVLIVVCGSFFTVAQMEQALVLRFGKPIRVVDMPGLHVKLPWQDVVDYDSRILDFDPPAEEVIASDQKRLVVDTYARFRIADPLEFYQSVGTEQVRAQRLGTIISGACAASSATSSCQAVISAKRAEIMRHIRDEVNAQAKGFGIDVVDVRIRRADLPEQNSQAIYDAHEVRAPARGGRFRAEGARQAQQIRANADRQRIEIIAEAQEAGADPARPGRRRRIRISADAYGKDKDFFAFYRSLQAYRDRVDRPDTTFVLSPDSAFFRYLQNGPEQTLPAALGRGPGGSRSPDRGQIRQVRRRFRARCRFRARAISRKIAHPVRAHRGSAFLVIRHRPPAVPPASDRLCGGVFGRRWHRSARRQGVLMLALLAPAWRSRRPTASPISPPSCCRRWSTSRRPRRSKADKPSHADPTCRNSRRARRSRNSSRISSTATTAAGRARDAMPRHATSLGSGFIIDPSGLVVTNNHVIADADEITVTLQDDTNFKAEVVGRDTKIDLALLRIKPAKPLPFVKFGDSDEHARSATGCWRSAIPSGSAAR